MRKPKAEWVLLDSNTQRCVCTHCGQSIPIPLGLVQWFCAVTRAFVEAHRYCQPGQTRERILCRFAEPVAPTGEAGTP